MALILNFNTMKNNYGNLLVNQNPHSPHYGKALALHWVIKMGADCDGYDSGISVTPFGCADLAKMYCDSCTFWSDGVTYFIISDVRKLWDFCQENDLYIEHYLYVDVLNLSGQDALIENLVHYYAESNVNLSQFYFDYQINLTDYSNPEL